MNEEKTTIIKEIQTVSQCGNQLVLTSLTYRPGHRGIRVGLAKTKSAAKKSENNCLIK
jgi:hypothetical protein